LTVSIKKCSHSFVSSCVAGLLQMGVVYGEATVPLFCSYIFCYNSPLLFLSVKRKNEKSLNILF